MCGRYVLRQNLAEICAAFGVHTDLISLEPRFNIAPESACPVIVRNKAGMASWGWPLIPGLNMSPVINIRSETMAEKPMFAGSVQAGRRCIVPASGFYEWDSSGQPFYVSAPQAPLMALCGLWTRDDKDQSVRFAILTQGAVAHLAPIHPRMPLVSTPQHAQAWLQTGAIPPVPALDVHGISPDINKPDTEGEALITPHAVPQGNLFGTRTG